MIVGLVSLNLIHCQINKKTECQLYIFIDEFGAYELFQKSDSSYIEYIDSLIYIKIYLHSCLGDMDFKVFENNSILVEGTYIYSGDTLENYFNIIDPNTLEEKVKKEKYFSPLKNGIWKYYNSKGAIIREEKWEKGTKQ